MSTILDPVQTFKIVVIGDADVGKSSLITRFVHGVFVAKYTATIGVDFKVAIMNIGAYKCRLQIWDTAGQERFRSLTSSYYRNADGVIIIYDVTNSTSFSNTKSRMPELDDYCDMSIPKILLGNKDDDNQTDKVVSTNDARDYAEKNHLPFFETSVRDNKNITEAFNEIAKLVLKRRIEQHKREQNTVPLQQQLSIDNGKKKACCS